MVASRWVTALLVAAVAGGLAHGQGTSGPRVTDGSVGYIDPAIPGDVFRLRFDAANDDRRPTRAEFFYPKTQPLGPGLPMPERSVDFEELSAYLELAASERFSGFINVPVRFLQPELNAHHAGISDLDTGVRFAFLRSDDLVATFQFRTYVPTGDSHRGLGTDHVSLEPAFLLYERLTERLALESELRLWTPIGGTDFAGNIIRYGVGAHYDLFCIEHCTFTPVAELVGWTVLDGKESVLPPSGVPFAHDAAGETIVTIKLGLRVKFSDRADLYGGYGRPLTGDRWYENIARVELRLFF
jgi:hypothetical protein